MKHYKHFLLVPVLLCAIAFLLPVSTTGHLAAEETQTSAFGAANTAPQLPYTIQIGDEFDVKSYYNPELNEHVIVRPDGKISLPIVNEVVAVGKTPEALAKELTDRYSSEFKQPQVAVILRVFGGQRVYVSGQVNKPGMVSLTGPVTVLQAISFAEGFTGEARMDQVIVIRRGQENRPAVTTVDLKKALNGSDVAQDMQLMPYDVVFVPRSRIANVDRFVDNFIRKLVPIPFAFSYRLDNKSVP